MGDGDCAGPPPGSAQSRGSRTSLLEQARCPVIPEPPPGGSGQEDPHVDTTSEGVTAPAPLPCSHSYSSQLCGIPLPPHRPSFLLPHFQCEEKTSSPAALPASRSQRAAATAFPPFSQLLLLQEKAEDTDPKYRHVPHPPAQLILALGWNPLTALLHPHPPFWLCWWEFFCLQ